MKKTSNAMIYSSIGVVIVLGIFFVTHGIPTWLNGEIEWFILSMSLAHGMVFTFWILFNVVILIIDEESDLKAGNRE